LRAHPKRFRIPENMSYCRHKVFGSFLLANAIPYNESVQPSFAYRPAERKTFVQGTDV
jgi:hypothetical protein